MNALAQNQEFAVVAHETEWLILQCSASKTLELARSLNEAGMGAWAPTTRAQRRTGDRRTIEEIEAPLMPSFVFAPARHLHALLALAHSPAMQYRVWDSEQRKMVVRGHPTFRLFRRGDHRFIPDPELEPLRRLERKPRPKRDERTFRIGQRVRTDEAGFAGLIGTVIAIHGKNVAVAFPRWPIEPLFPTWALRPLDASAAVNVNDPKPECDVA